MGKCSLGYASGYKCYTHFPTCGIARFWQSCKSKVCILISSVVNTRRCIEVGSLARSIQLPIRTLGNPSTPSKYWSDWWSWFDGAKATKGPNSTSWWDHLNILGQFNWNIGASATPSTSEQHSWPRGPCFGCSRPYYNWKTPSFALCKPYFKGQTTTFIWGSSSKGKNHV